MQYLEINSAVRLKDGTTVAEIPKVVSTHGFIKGDPVKVYESTSRQVGDGVIEMVNHEMRSVIVRVHWDTLAPQTPAGDTPAGDTDVESRPDWIPDPAEPPVNAYGPPGFAVVSKEECSVLSILGGQDLLVFCRVSDVVERVKKDKGESAMEAFNVAVVRHGVYYSTGTEITVRAHRITAVTQPLVADQQHGWWLSTGL